jgi:hypothetical protein
MNMTRDHGYDFDENSAKILAMFTRVARWFIFKPKIPFMRVLQWQILVYFMTIWSILRPLEIIYGRLVYFMSFGHFSPFWYFVPKKYCNPDVYLKYF